MKSISKKVSKGRKREWTRNEVTNCIFTDQDILALKLFPLFDVLHTCRLVVMMRMRDLLARRYPKGGRDLENGQ